MTAPTENTMLIINQSHSGICLGCFGEGLDEDDEYCPYCGGEGVITLVEDIQK